MIQKIRILMIMSIVLLFGCSTMKGVESKSYEEYLHIDLPPMGFEQIAKDVYIPQGQTIDNYDRKMTIHEFDYVDKTSGIIWYAHIPASKGRNEQVLFSRNLRAIDNNVISCSLESSKLMPGPSTVKDKTERFGRTAELYILCDSEVHLLKLLAGSNKYYVVSLTLVPSEEDLQWVNAGRQDILKRKYGKEIKRWKQYSKSIKVIR